MITSNWFITGISRAFGRVLAEQALIAGHSVVGTTRSGEPALRHERLTVLPLDVTDVKQVTGAVHQAIKRLSRLDVIVNNAGFGLVGGIEEVSRLEIDRVFETNVFGTWNVIQAVLPQLRKQRHGHIMNLSSVGGLVGVPGFGVYNSAKFAVEGMSEALAGEVRPHGIHVTIIEPGTFRTDFLANSSLQRSVTIIGDYQATVGETRKYVAERNGVQMGDPVRAVKVILAAAASASPPLHLPLGQDAIDRIRSKFKAFEADIAEWQQRSAATRFDP